jgi:hypothetical protein
MVEEIGVPGGNHRTTDRDLKDLRFISKARETLLDQITGEREGKRKDVWKRASWLSGHGRWHNSETDYATPD